MLFEKLKDHVDGVDRPLESLAAEALVVRLEKPRLLAEHVNLPRRQPRPSALHASAAEEAPSMRRSLEALT